jgi:hypothetical protein
MHDPYAGHRNYEDPWWQPDPLRDTQWIEWDYALLEACETIKMLESPSSGQMRNLSEDPDVYWEIDYRVDYGAQELDRFHKDNEPEPGVNVYLTNPQKRNGEPFWTLTDWLDNIEKGSPQIDRNAPEGAQGPSPEDLLALQERRRKAASAE